MEDIIRTDVLAVAPELSTSALNDQFWVDALSYCNEMDFTSLDTDQTVRMARIYLCAHMGTRAKKGATGAVGPVISEAAGGVRRAYGFSSTSAITANVLGTTSYGITLLTILGMSGAAGPMLI